MVETMASQMAVLWAGQKVVMTEVQMAVTTAGSTVA
jgi:hypothetical protein